MDKIEALNKVKQYHQLLGKHMQFETMYLFGSYAKNSTHEDSDIDVAVIVNNLDMDFFDVNPLLWKLRREIDDRIEPILIDSAHDNSGFINEIRKHGIEIHS
ncbi:MAG: nucleotidyltransferase domain-containing protein [Bacteroidota bacterium]|nr:nucleotidyltransferase domain-containing protein [Bacteroidota bacterium]